MKWFTTVYAFILYGSQRKHFLPCRLVSVVPANRALEEGKSCLYKPLQPVFFSFQYSTTINFLQQPAGDCYK
jgi:hypothetical protein